MTNRVNNTQNNQQVNLNSFKVGQKINSCNTQKKKSIFNAIDKNNDGVISKDEMQGVVKGKVKNKEGKLVEKEYLKLKDMREGRSLVVDANGKQWVRAKDGTILKDSYVKNGFKKPTNTPPKPATNSQKLAAANLGKAYKRAEAAFNKQLKDDGWAEDVADGISKLWNNDLFGGGTGNTASQVRKEMQAEKKRVLALQKAAKQSDSAFRTQFKKIYGVNYNQAAVDAYNKNPNETNYKKAFGTKIESIEKRVARYNQSQQTGGAAVKTGTKVVGGITVGVATGGTGFVALGATALGTAAVSVAVEESDRANVTGTYKDASGKTVKQKGAFKEGTDHGKILKDAAWDGAGVLAGGAVGAVAGKVVTGTTKAAIAGRAAINIGGDVAMGAAQEYAETGEVTAGGVITNAAMSGIGSAVTSGVLQKGFKKVKNAVTGHADVTPSSAKVHTDTPKVDADAPKTNFKGATLDNTTPGIKIVRRNSTKAPVHELPIKENIDIGDNKVVRRINENEIALTNKGKIPERFTIERGKRKIVTDKSGEVYIISHNSLNGKIHIQKKLDVGIQTPLKVTSSANIKSKTDMNSFLSQYGLDDKSYSNYLKNQLNNNKISDNKHMVLSQKSMSQKLFDLKQTNPKRFNKLVESGALDLVKEGKLPIRMFDFVDSNSLFTNKFLTGIKKLKNGETNVLSLPRDIELSNISKYVEKGNVCEVNGKLYVNDNGKPVSINMSKEKFEELFPATTTFVQQGQVADCWLVSALDNMMDKPDGRTAIYQLFRQEGNDIYIKFPNATKEIKFTNGQVVNANGHQLKGAPGLQLVEQSYSVHRSLREAQNYAQGTSITKMSGFTDIEKQMRRLDGGWSEELFADVFGNKAISGQIEIYNPSDSKKMVNILKKYANDENCFINVATKYVDGESFWENMIDNNYNIFSRHAYSLKGYNAQNNSFIISNPWNTGLAIEIPSDKFKEYFDTIHFSTTKGVNLEKEYENFGKRLI